MTSRLYYHDLYILWQNGQIECKEKNKNLDESSWIWTIIGAIFTLFSGWGSVAAATNSHPMFIQMYWIMVPSFMAAALLIRYVLMRYGLHILAGLITLIFLSIPGGIITWCIKGSVLEIIRYRDKKLVAKDVREINSIFGDSYVGKKELNDVLQKIYPASYIGGFEVEQVKKEAMEIFDYLLEKELIPAGLYNTYVALIHTGKGEVPSVSNNYSEKPMPTYSLEKLKKLLEIGEITKDEYDKLIQSIEEK